MVGVGENDLRIKLFERLLREAFNRGRRAHRHECRRIDYAMRRGQAAETRAGRIRLQYFELESHPANCIRSGIRLAKRANPADMDENPKGPDGDDNH